VNLSVDGGDDRATAVLVQPDGKIVVAGIGDTYRRLTLTRFTASGALDTAFGSGGTTVVPNASGFAVARQPDGRLLVAGRLKSTFAVFRFTEGGVLDAGFGSSGVYSVGFGASAGDANALAIQADGKIVVAGAAYFGDTEKLVLVRITAGGGSDGAFGAGGGWVATQLGGTYAAGHGVAVQPDGKIVVGADQRAAAGTQTQAAVRFTSTGTLDASFNGAGFRLVAPSGLAANTGVALQPDGKIMLVGTSYGPKGFQSIELARVGGDGTLDASFGSGGIARATVGGALSTPGTGLSVQPDGRIVVVGSAFGSGQPLLATSRFKAGGGLDASFGSAGTVLTAFGIFTVSQYGEAVALQPDGKIVAAGAATISPELPTMVALARYGATGSSTGGLIVTIPTFDLGTKSLVFEVACDARRPCSGTGTIVPDTTACRRNPQRPACNLGSARLRLSAGRVVTTRIALNRRGRTFDRSHPGGKIVLRVQSLGKRRRTRMLPTTLAGRSVIVQSCPDPTMLGGRLAAAGSLYPAVAGASVSVRLTSPSGQATTTDLPVGSDGAFTLERQATEAGQWTIHVSWAGTARQLRAEALPCFPIVLAPAPPEPPTTTTTTTATTTTTPQKQSSSLSLNCPPGWQQGAALPVNGTLSPGLANESIKLVYAPGQGSSTQRTVSTSGGGSYSDSGYVPNQTGALKVTATWAGNSAYDGSSASCTVTVT
jgi:uncharacterized delta-60 repeat protein